MDRGTCRLQSMGSQRGMTKQLKHTHTHASLWGWKEGTGLRNFGGVALMYLVTV